MPKQKESRSRIHPKLARILSASARLEGKRIIQVSKELADELEENFILSKKSNEKKKQKFKFI